MVFNYTQNILKSAYKHSYWAEFLLPISCVLDKHWQCPLVIHLLSKKVFDFDFDPQVLSYSQFLLIMNIVENVLQDARVQNTWISTWMYNIQLRVYLKVLDVALHVYIIKVGRSIHTQHTPQHIETHHSLHPTYTLLEYPLFEYE
jgi:hypothetical protein